MLRNRILILLGGCVLAATAAKADDLGYVDCRNHPDETQVFAKARQTHETVASVACGERFTILLYGFIFSRIQTKDGKTGYVYSSVISADRSSGTLQPASSRVPVPRSPAPATTTAVAQPKPADAAPQASAPAQEAVTRAPVTTSNLPTPPTTVEQPSAADATQIQTAATQPQATAATAAPTASVAGTSSAVAETSTPSTSAPSAPSAPSATTETRAALAPSVSPEAALPPASVTEAPAAQPEAASAPQPETAAAEPPVPATPAIRPAKATESWEKPNESMRTVGLRRLPLIELFGGYAFTRFDNGGGSTTNFNGVLGSFGWNVKPWLQIVADTSYSVVTISGVKNVIYGNHYGPRIFRRVRNRWGITPFVEGLVGGSRADASTSGSGAYTTSQNCLSYKVGGGIDVHPTRHIELRLVDFDYYRTAFGTNLHQNNYWASTGIVIRLFGGSE